MSKLHLFVMQSPTVRTLQILYISHICITYVYMHLYTYIYMRCELQFTYLCPPLLLYFFQNNKLTANSAGSHGNKLKNKQKSKCMATILNNKCAETQYHQQQQQQ